MFKGTGTLDRRFETRPLPLDRVVKWLPRDDAFYLLAAVLTSASAEPLVVTREALLRVERHLREPERASGCGILLGATCVCPRTRIRYLLVEGAVRAVTAITEHEPPATTVARLRALAAEVQRRGKQQVVGWYRGGAAIVPRVSSRDVAVHRELFPDPWRVALLRDSAGAGHAGAFVRVEPVEERAYLTPFHELLPRTRWRGRETRHTAVAWGNYRTERDVEPLSEVMAGPNGGIGAPVPHTADPVVNLEPRERVQPVWPMERLVWPVREGPARVERKAAPAPAPVPEALPPQPAPPTPAAPIEPVRQQIAAPPSVPPPQEHGGDEPVIAAQPGIQSPANPIENDRTPAPPALESASEPVAAAPAPPEPLEFIWVPPRDPVGGAAKEQPWRVWYWVAAAAIALVVLLMIWRATW